MESGNANSKQVRARRTAAGPASPLADSLHVRLVNALILCRGIDCRVLDEKRGCEAGTFSAMRSKDFPGESIRAKVERSLSCRIFSDERTWHLREACFRRYSFDPALLEKAELKEWIARLDIQHRVPPNAGRPALVQTILNFFAANPND
jgi:hypothetical protein